MKSTTKTESDIRNSQHAIPKSCAFALGAVLLTTLFFPSAAHAQSCIYSQNYTRWAATCPLTNSTGNVWVAVSGIWQLQEYYSVDTTWFYVYHYGPKLWTAEKRPTGELWVEITQGQWITYANYNATVALSSLTKLLNSQIQTGGTAPTFTIVPYNWRDEYCRNVRYFQQYYAYYGAPIIADPLCP